MVIVGLLAAAALCRAGHPVPGMLACALTGLLVSPLSWDHHWVWVALGIALAGHLAVRAHGWARAAWWAVVALLLFVFGAWPQFWDRTQGLTPAGWVWYGPTSTSPTATTPRTGIPLKRAADGGRELVRAGRAARPGRAARSPRSGCASQPSGVSAAPRTGSGKPLPAVIDAELDSLRDRMVTQVTNSGRPVSAAVVQAMRVVPRHLFLPDLEPGPTVTRPSSPGAAPRASPPVPRPSRRSWPSCSISSGSPPASGCWRSARAPVQRGAAPAPRGRQGDRRHGGSRRGRRAAGRGAPDRGRLSGRNRGPRRRGRGLPPRGPVRPGDRDGRGQRPRPRLAGPARPRRTDRRPARPAGIPASVAFEWDGESWQSRSVVPCGFMRMRGMLAGPERTRVTHDAHELALTLPAARTPTSAPSPAHWLTRLPGRRARHPGHRRTGAAVRRAGVLAGPERAALGGLSESAQAPGGLARAVAFMAERRITAGIFADGGIRRPGPA